MTTARRSLLKGATSWCALSLSPWAVTQTPPSASVGTARRFDPQPGAWRTFEVTTRVDMQSASGPTRVWVPVPSVNTD